MCLLFYFSSIFQGGQLTSFAPICGTHALTCIDLQRYDLGEVGK